jgi:hypothetical protein
VNRTVVTQNLSDAQLLLPLLDEIAKAGGIARPGEVYDRLAARLAIPDEVRNLTVVMGDGREVNAYERRLLNSSGGVFHLAPARMSLGSANQGFHKFRNVRPNSCGARTGQTSQELQLFVARWLSQTAMASTPLPGRARKTGPMRSSSVAGRLTRLRLLSRRNASP